MDMTVTSGVLYADSTPFNLSLGVQTAQLRSRRIIIDGNQLPAFTNDYQIIVSFAGGYFLQIRMGTIGNQPTFTNDEAGLALASAYIGV